ncbi:hypothetical protein [Plantactinospora soyae]|uniref:Transmembrane protein n=1 Tax=Plantactinospora soyae TaxID=1544732 RepID=A0A927M3T1_9ACTN|nr:hypothetical protein [Plantactinospora soyae]MBE1487653.1 hypothetical protein [Plantactinospora soyae]
MKRYLSSALAPTAEKHRLGALISLHRQERPLIRFRARWLWLILGGLFIGLLWVLWDRQYSRYHQYSLYPDGAYFAFIATLHVMGLVFSGPIAARLLPPDGPDRWVALYEHGLIDVTRPFSDAAGRMPEHDLIIRPVRFEQIRRVDQHRESVGMVPTGMARTVTATSAGARIVAERDGKPLVLEYHGYRHQDRFVDAVRTRRAGGPSPRSEAALRRSGAVFGNLAVMQGGLRVVDGVGLGPAEPPTLRWDEVVRVHESDDGTLSIYRQGRPGERPGEPDTSMRWYSGIVPETSEAAALITRMRNKALS